ALDPLEPDETAALVAHVLGAAPSARLAATLHDRTGGVPFLVEEFTAALRTGERLRDAPDGSADLDLDLDVPLPQTVRDAVLVHLSELPDAVRAAAEVAAVAGPVVDLDVLAGMEDEHG